MRDRLGGFDFADLAVRAPFPPVIGHVAGGWLKLDLRTIAPGEDATVITALRQALG